MIKKLWSIEPAGCHTGVMPRGPWSPPPLWKGRQRRKGLQQILPNFLRRRFEIVALRASSWAVWGHSQEVNELLGCSTSYSYWTPSWISTTACIRPLMGALQGSTSYGTPRYCTAHAQGSCNDASYIKIVATNPSGTYVMFQLPLGCPSGVLTPTFISTNTGLLSACSISR